MADDKKTVIDAEILKALVEVVKAAGAQTAAAPSAPKALPFMKAQSLGQQCSECSQPGFVDHTGVFFACRGNHTQMVVFPQETERFQGLFLNGVRYKSNQSGHPITVPADNDFAALLQVWDKQERENRTGRKVRPSQYDPTSRPPVNHTGNQG